MTFLEETVLGQADTTTCEDPAVKSEWRHVTCAASDYRLRTFSNFVLLRSWE